MLSTRVSGFALLEFGVDVGLFTGYRLTVGGVLLLMGSCLGSLECFGQDGGVMYE